MKKYKEIVINKCFGGFSISREAIEYIVKKGGGSLKKYVPKNYYGGREGWKYQFAEDQKKNWNIVIDGFIWSTREIKRDDPLLIETVKKLKESANGNCAELEIVKIPDNVDWEIDEYDGMETVEEKHNSWG